MKFLIKEETYSYGFVSIRNEKRVISEFIKILNKKASKYSHGYSYYKKNKKYGSLNKKNAYNLLEMELNIIETLLKKLNLIMRKLRGNNVKIKDADVKKYLSLID